MKGVYLFSGNAIHENYDLDYIDLDPNSKANIVSSVFDLDLSKYDYFIATPPCNFWSKARGNRKPSDYALATAPYLLWCLTELPKYNKPILIENVRNLKKFIEHGVMKAAQENNFNVKFVGRHTYFCNKDINLDAPQDYDFRYGGYRLKAARSCQGGENVHRVIEKFLKEINNA